MENTTKERILDAALICFAKNGYRGTNLRDLAAGMGLSKSALYKHFSSKEEIWNALIDRMEAYYEERFGSPEHLPPVPQSAKKLEELALRMFRFTVSDEKIRLVRKVLLVEQFRDERARKLATGHFSAGLENLFAKLFAGMMENGSLKREDPAMLAFSFTAPVSSLVHLSDREPDRRDEIVEKAGAFIRHFIGQYGMEKEIKP